MKPIIDFSPSLPSSSSLEKGSAPGPIFLPEDGVSGYVSLVSSKGASTCDNLEVEIRLIGHSTVSMTWQESPIPTGERMGYVDHRKIMDHVQHVPVRVDKTRISQATTRSKFHFPLKQEIGKRGLCFPSSLEHKSSMMPGWSNSDPMTAASITYELQFKVHHRGALVVEETRKIYIFDCSDGAPPICVEDFGSEYNANTTILLRRNFFQKVAYLAIGAMQPRPLVFMAGVGLATTGIPIRAALHSAAQKTELVHGLSQLEVDVSWRLQTSTFVSLGQVAGQPTVSQAVHSRSLVRLVSIGKPYGHKTYWSDWSPSRPSKDSKDHSTSEYTTDHTVWISLPSSMLLTPTMSLQGLSRRYCILLEVKVWGSSRSRSLLKIPVQVVYHSQSANDSQETAPPVPAGALLSQDDSCTLPPYMVKPDLG